MRALHAAVLATRRFPGFAALYGGVYRGGAQACAAGLASLPGTHAVVLHRGAARAPDPGVSDLDFILVRGSLEPREEAGWLTRLAVSKRRLKRAFPMLGDLWAAEPIEVERYLRMGGLRAWEDRPGWRVLRGDLPAAPAYAGDPLKRRLDAWTWAFTAHMELTRRLLTPASDLPAKRDADLRKMHADCRRLSDFILSRDAVPAPRPVPDARDARVLWLDSARALSEASAVLAAEAAESEGSVAAWPEPADAGSARTAEALRRSLRARAVVFDAPYHSWAVLEDVAGPERLWEASLALAGEPLAPGVPMALTASAWSLLIQSPYLGAPLGGADGPALRPGPGLFAGWGPSSVGDPRAGLKLLPASRRRAAAAEAASWMALWWRGLWTEESFGNRFVLYHLHVRAAQLALALAGKPVPSAWDVLLEGPALKFAREEPAACVDGLPRAALADAHVTAAAGAQHALGGLL